jgi:RNA polymerase sigma-70 factor (ECF subfamily)
MAAPEFEELFRGHYARLVRALTVAAGNAEDAADAVQEAFVQLHRHWRRVRRYDDPVGWLRRVATNRVLNQRRGRERYERARANVPQSDPVTASEHAIWDEVKALPTQQRTVIGLHYLGELSVQEVAEAMGIAPGTVKSHLHDARQRLRERLEVTDNG